MNSVLEQLTVNAAAVPNVEALAGDTCNSPESISVTHMDIIARHKLNASGGWCHHQYFLNKSVLV